MHESPDERVDPPDVGDRTRRYAGRVKLHTVQRDQQRRRSTILARLRLTTFLTGAGVLLWAVGFGGGGAGFSISAGLFAVFAVLVVVHARVEARAEWFEALRIVNDRAIARITRDWNVLPDAPPRLAGDVAAHPYAVDLDLFGRASVFQWLGPAATESGSQVLERWIMSPAPPGEVVSRQQAVAELAPLEDWREHLAAFGIVGGVIPGESLERFLVWAEDPHPPLPGYRLIRALVYLVLVSMWLLFLLHVTGVMPNNIWPGVVIAGMVLSFLTAGRVSHAFERAGSGERTLHEYEHLFAHLGSAAFRAQHLNALQERLRATGQSAPAVMRKLGRILGYSNLRRGAALIHFPVQVLTLWDFHWLFALERWRRASGTRIRDWFEAAGELDALSCLAAVRRDNPSWCFPEFGSDRRYLATALGHPLIDERRRVDNEVEVGPAGTVLLVTGSNMSGKSTLLRAIGVNAVLAQCGAPVCARSLRMPYCDVYTSIRIQDSLERGISYFMAALARLKQVVDAAEREPGDRVLLYLLDEILQGTNSAERGIAVQAVAKHLLEAGAIGAMTTHDLNIAGEDPLRTAARLVHFSEIVDESGTMRFDYRLRPGLATSRNAIRLMKLIGIDI